MVLRPDITPSIARCAAMYFGEEKMPIRLCYMGNTFLNNSSYQGRLKESTQLGAELLGDSTVDADAEIIAMVIDCLKKAGLKEFQLSVGHAEFFRGLTDAAGLKEEQEEERYRKLDEAIRSRQMNRKEKKQKEKLSRRKAKAEKAGKHRFRTKESTV